MEYLGAEFNFKENIDRLLAGAKHKIENPWLGDEVGQETSFNPEFKATRWSKGFYTCPETKIIWKEIA